MPSVLQHLAADVVAVVVVVLTGATVYVAPQGK